MATRFQSEVRESTIRNLLEKVKRGNYGSYLRSIRLNKVRAFQGEVVTFDFPVTAVVGTNGGGKSTVLGAAALAYKSGKPAVFFPRSSFGDQSMADWGITYDLIEKAKNPTQAIQRTASFKAVKWDRSDLINRSSLHFPIQRTVPAGERTEFKKYATFKSKFSAPRALLDADVRKQVETILGKDFSHFERIEVSSNKAFYVGGDGKVTYSEFHFGAGESSVIRMVSEIERAPENSLITIEEIENGLHPVATRRMVEYLIDAAERRSIQAIFTTHSEYALDPLPEEAIWAAFDGKAQQGKISIEGLRAFVGKVEERLAIFVEDTFARDWIIGILRTLSPEYVGEVGVYAVSGDSRAVGTHRAHRTNPAVKGKIDSLCILDGDSRHEEDLEDGILKLPGKAPESAVFDYVRDNIQTLAMRLAVSLHLHPDKEKYVCGIVEQVSKTNRDHHLLFSQVGQKVGFVAENIVSSAFVSLWIEGNPGAAKRVADFVSKGLSQAREC